uniref:Uncharacterized protein n=1 Tax=Hyaloperonospora arabidopsidis (strain Emoy2) TaxID=559515 RepID=M4B842_HYAAE
MVMAHSTGGTLRVGRCGRSFISNGGALSLSSEASSARRSVEDRRCRMSRGAAQRSSECRRLDA